MQMKMQMKLNQQLIMTPQLQQAIKMLTLTHLEMTNVIAQEMVENPMLEEVSSDEPENNSEVDYKAEKLEQENKEAGSESFDEAPIFEKDDLVVFLAKREQLKAVEDIFSVGSI